MGDYVLIATSAPTGASVVFSSLGSYTHLDLRYSGRSTTLANSTSLLLSMNGDTGTNYDREAVSGVTGSVTASEGIGTTGAIIGNVAGASAAAGLVGNGIIHFYDCQGASFQKQFTSIGGFRTGQTTGGAQVQTFNGGYRSTAGMTSISVTLAAGNFVLGSKFSLFGLT